MVRALEPSWAYSYSTDPEKVAKSRLLRLVTRHWLWMPTWMVMVVKSVVVPVQWQSCCCFGMPWYPDWQLEAHSFPCTWAHVSLFLVSLSLFLSWRLSLLTRQPGIALVLMSSRGRRSNSKMTTVVSSFLSPMCCYFRMKERVIVIQVTHTMYPPGSTHPIEHPRQFVIFLEKVALI